MLASLNVFLRPLIDSQGLGVNPDNELELALVRAALADEGEDVGRERAGHLGRERAQGLEVAVCQMGRCVVARKERAMGAGRRAEA